MKAYYYSVIIKARGKIQQIVEYNDFMRVVNFYNAIKKNSVEKYHECEVQIFKEFVSLPSASVLIDSFKAINMDEIKKASLMVK